MQTIDTGMTHATGGYSSAPPLIKAPPGADVAVEMPMATGYYSPAPPLTSEELMQRQAKSVPMEPDTERVYTDAPPVPGTMTIRPVATEFPPIEMPEEPTVDTYADDCAIDGWMLGINGEAFQIDKIRAITIQAGDRWEVCADCGADHLIRVSTHTGPQKQEKARESRDAVMAHVSEYLRPTELIKELASADSDSIPARRGPGRPKGS